MKPFSIILSVCFCVVVSSCMSKSKPAIEKEYLSSMVQTYHFPKETEWAVILPGLGCHGCIQEGETFMKEYVNAKNTSFILTRIESLKILFQKTGVKANEHD